MKDETIFSGVVQKIFQTFAIDGAKVLPHEDEDGKAWVSLCMLDRMSAEHSVIKQGTLSSMFDSTGKYF
jgi:hypothetical protein